MAAVFIDIDGALWKVLSRYRRPVVEGLKRAYRSCAVYDCTAYGWSCAYLSTLKNDKKTRHKFIKRGFVRRLLSESYGNEIIQVLEEEELERLKEIVEEKIRMLSECIKENHVREWVEQALSVDACLGLKRSDLGLDDIRYEMALGIHASILVASIWHIIGRLWPLGGKQCEGVCVRGQYGLSVLARRMLLLRGIEFLSYDLNQGHEEECSRDVMISFYKNMSIGSARTKKALEWNDTYKAGNEGTLDLKLIDKKVERLFGSHHSVYSPSVDTGIGTLELTEKYIVVYLSSPDEDMALKEIGKLMDDCSTNDASSRSQLQMLCEWEEYLGKVDELGMNVMFRAHPRMGKTRRDGIASEDIVTRETLKKLDKLNMHKNVCVIYPEDKISSYLLGLFSEACFAYHSSIALDLELLGCNCYLIEPLMEGASPFPRWVSCVDRNKRLSVDDCFVIARGDTVLDIDLPELIEWNKSFTGLDGCRLEDIAEEQLHVVGSKSFGKKVARKIDSVRRKKPVLVDKNEYYRYLLGAVYHPIALGKKPAMAFRAMDRIGVELETGNERLVIDDRVNGVSYKVLVGGNNVEIEGVHENIRWSKSLERLLLKMHELRVGYDAEKKS